MRTRTRSIRPDSCLLLLFALLGSAGCDGGGGDEQVVVLLDSDASCYGVQVDVAGADDGTVCQATSELAERSCNAFASLDSSMLGLSVRGCFVPAGTPLFECSASRATVTRIRDASQVRCGCGCAENCPTAPALEICNAGDASCLAASSSAADAKTATAAPAAPASMHSSSIQSVSTSTSTLFCGTCCDVFSEEQILATSLEPLSELSFTVSMPASDPHCPRFGNCSISTALFDGPSHIEPDGERSLRICVTKTNAGVMRHRLVASWEVQSGGSPPLVFSDVEALGAGLEPMAEPPFLAQN